MRLLLVGLLASGACLFMSACNGSPEEDIRGQVTLLLHQEGAPAHAASAKLIAHGKRAIPTIESAMHTASPAGKKSLIAVLRQIGDESSIPLLAHIAVFEPDEDVRREALWTLQAWAKEQNPRGEKARAALRDADEARQREEAG